MSHMQQEITTKQRGWRVETKDGGTCYLPGDVVKVPDAIKTAVVMEPIGEMGGAIFEAIAAMVRDYLEGFRIESIEVCEGYFARMTAPGYLDCTSWLCYPTVKEARASLREVEEESRGN